MNIEQLKKIAEECVFSVEGITIIKTEEYYNRLNQITQLTNNWNDLEEWLKTNAEETIEIMEKLTYQECYDKMKELKEKNNGQS